jgi:hypothetical protein
MAEWIATSEQLPIRRYVEGEEYPAISIDVVFYRPHGSNFYTGHYDFEEEAFWCNLGGYASDATHWFPLPNPPLAGMHGEKP